MTVDPPGHLPDVVLAAVRRMVPTIGAAAASQQLPTREHVHKLVDQLLDVGETLAEMTQVVHVPARQAMRPSTWAAPRTSGVGGAAPADARLGALVLGPVGAGESATAELMVHSDGAAALNGLELRCVALVTETGAKIAGSAITVEPEFLDLHPRSSRIVDVRITVPSGVAAGTYTGVLSAVGNPGIRTVILVEVG